MVTVKEGLQRCNRKKLFDVFFGELNPNAPEIDKLNFNSWVNSLLDIEEVKSDMLITSMKYINDDYYNGKLEIAGRYLDTTASKIEDIKTFNFDAEKIAVFSKLSIKKMGYVDCQNIFDNFKTPQSYAIEFTSRKEVLGFYIADTSIQKYGLELILAGVLDEISFFGYDEELMEEKRDDLCARAEEVEAEEKRIEAGEITLEESKIFSRAMTLKDLELSIKDERSEKTKALDRLYNTRVFAANAFRRYRYLYSIHQELVNS